MKNKEIIRKLINFDEEDTSTGFVSATGDDDGDITAYTDDVLYFESGNYGDVKLIKDGNLEGNCYHIEISNTDVGSNILTVDCDKFVRWWGGKGVYLLWPEITNLTYKGTWRNIQNVFTNIYFLYMPYINLLIKCNYGDTIDIDYGEWVEAFNERLRGWEDLYSGISGREKTGFKVFPKGILRLLPEGGGDRILGLNIKDCDFRGYGVVAYAPGSVTPNYRVRLDFTSYDSESWYSHIVNKEPLISFVTYSIPSYTALPMDLYLDLGHDYPDHTNLYVNSKFDNPGNSLMSLEYNRKNLKAIEANGIITKTINERTISRYVNKGRTKQNQIYVSNH